MPRSVADHVAATAAAAMLAELETWPKPGLVSQVDSGSRTDMDACKFRASVAAITPFFGCLGCVERQGTTAVGGGGLQRRRVGSLGSRGLAGLSGRLGSRGPARGSDG